MLLRMALFFLNYPVRISQKSCRATQNYGDNDLDGVRNVKIAALIGQCHTAAVEQIVGFGIDMGREFSHG
jgi:hypothetical protein